MSVTSQFFGNQFPTSFPTSSYRTGNQTGQRSYMPQYGQSQQWDGFGAGGFGNMQGFNGFQSRSMTFGGQQGQGFSNGFGGQTFGAKRFGQGQGQIGQFGGLNGQQPPPPPNPQEMFTKWDTDSDGLVTQKEWTAGRPTGMPTLSAEKEAEMWSHLDANGDGSLTEEEVAAARPPQGQRPPGFGGQTFGAQRFGQGQGQFGQLGGMNGQQPPDPAKMFAKIDADGDGVVTQEELIAGRPQGKPTLSADKEAEMWSRLDANGDGGVTAEEFAAAGPPPGPPPGGRTFGSTQGAQFGQFGTIPGYGQGRGYGMGQGFGFGQGLQGLSFDQTGTLDPTTLGALNGQCAQGA